MSSKDGKKRIALVTNDFRSGGLQTMTLFLHRTLMASGRYRPDVISLATSANDGMSILLRRPRSWRRGVQVQAGESAGIAYRHVGAHWAEIEIQRYRPRTTLDELLEGYDLVQFVVGTPSWALAAGRVGVPVLLWTATTTWPDRVSRLRCMSLLRRAWFWFMSQLAQACECRALEQVDHVFALSRYTAEAVRAWVPDGKLSLAVCGVDIDRFHPAKQAREDYILCVGRLSDPRKNLHLLLAAYAHLVPRFPDLPDLCLVGETPAQARQWAVELGIDGKVRFLGTRYGVELAEIYRKARIFALSSDEEGLAMVVVEAMASGLPVVSTNCGGPATAIDDGQTGFLTPVGQVAPLSDALARLLDDPPLCAQMGRAGREKAERYFSLEAAGQVFLDRYDDLLLKDVALP